MGVSSRGLCLSARYGTNLPSGSPTWNAHVPYRPCSHNNILITSGINREFFQYDNPAVMEKCSYQLRMVLPYRLACIPPARLGESNSSAAGEFWGRATRIHARVAYGWHRARRYEIKHIFALVRPPGVLTGASVGMGTAWSQAETSRSTIFLKR